MMSSKWLMVPGVMIFIQMITVLCICKRAPSWSSSDKNSIFADIVASGVMSFVSFLCFYFAWQGE